LRTSRSCGWTHGSRGRLDSLSIVARYSGYSLPYRAAMRSMPGTSSRSISNRFVSKSTVAAHPCHIPPGRESGHKDPLPTGSPACTHDHGDCSSGILCCQVPLASLASRSDLPLRPDQLGRQVGEALTRPQGTIFDDKVAPLDVTKFASPWWKASRFAAFQFEPPYPACQCARPWRGLREGGERCGECA
jgi:hypothetical protein